MNTGAQMENRKSRFARMALSIYAAVPLVALVAVSSLIQTREEKVWDSARTLTVSTVTEVGDLRVVSFANTDTLLIFIHAPDGWFVPKIKLHTIQYRHDPYMGALIRYHLTKPNGKDETRQSHGDVFVDRNTLVSTLSAIR